MLLLIAVSNLNTEEGGGEDRRDRGGIDRVSSEEDWHTQAEKSACEKRTTYSRTFF